MPCVIVSCMWKVESLVLAMRQTESGQGYICCSYRMSFLILVAELGGIKARMGGSGVQNICNQMLLSCSRTSCTLNSL